MDRSLLEIRKDDGQAVMFFLTEPADTNTTVDTARLVFDRYGEERFLHAILIPGDTGNQLRVSTQENEAALATARAAAGMAVVTSTVRSIPQEIQVGKKEGLARPSVINFDNVHVVAKALLGERIGSLTSTREREVKRALGYALDWSELKVP